MRCSTQHAKCNTKCIMVQPLYSFPTPRNHSWMNSSEIYCDSLNSVYFEMELSLKLSSKLPPFSHVQAWASTRLLLLKTQLMLDLTRKAITIFILYVAVKKWNNVWCDFQFWYEKELNNFRWWNLLFKIRSYLKSSKKDSWNSCPGFRDVVCLCLALAHCSMPIHFVHIYDEYSITN